MQCIQSFKIVFLKIQNVQIRPVFPDLVTYYEHVIIFYMHGQIKGCNRSITTILFEVGSYRNVVETLVVLTDVSLSFMVYVYFVW